MALTKVKAGNILLTTPGASSNDVTPATTAYVTTALANLADSAPSTLDTLNELAAALGDDANFSTTVTNSIAAKLPLAGGTLTGTLTTPTLITGAYGGSGSAGDGFRLNSTDLYGQIDASDKIRLNVNGVSFINGGNVGIGDISPIAKLTVKAASDTIRAESLATDAKNITMSYHDGNDQGQIFCGQDGVVDKNIVLRGHTLIFQRNGGTEALRIVANGDVALGANATGAAIIKHVAGDQTDRNTGGYPQYTFVGNEGTGMRRASSNILALDAGGTEVMRLASGNVGIGTAGYGTYYSGDSVIGLGTGSTIRAANSGADPWVTMANNSYHDASSWKYIHADFASSYEQYNGTHTWNTAASGSAGAAVPFAPRMKIISSGEVGIGVTPVAHYTGYRALDIGTAMSLFSNSGSTNVATMTNNGYLNSGASQWTYKVTDEATMYSQVHGDHRFSTAASGSAGGAITWSEKVRIQAAGGISFNGDTAAANALDDYEEGTWTPTINSGTATGNLGSYTKIGRQVTVTYYLNLTTLGGSQVAVSVGGLPFTSNNINAGSQSAGSVLCRYFTGNQIVSYVYGNTTNINYYDNTSADWDQVTFGEIEPFHDADFVAHGTLTYFAA